MKKSSTCKLWNCDLEKLIVQLHSLISHDSGRLNIFIHTINLPIESCSRRFNENDSSDFGLCLDNKEGRKILTFQTNSDKQIFENVIFRKNQIFVKLKLVITIRINLVSAVGKSIIKRNHDFYRKINIFSVKSTYFTIMEVTY